MGVRRGTKRRVKEREIGIGTKGRKGNVRKENARRRIRGKRGMNG